MAETRFVLSKEQIAAIEDAANRESIVEIRKSKDELRVYEHRVTRITNTQK